MESGKFSPSSWEGPTNNNVGPNRDTDTGLDSAGLQNEGVLVVDINDDVDSSKTRYQGNAVPQRHECQPVPNPANQYRWFPETSSSSSSDEMSDELLPADPTIRPSPYVEDEETVMSKQILVDKLFVEEDVGFRCKACQYRTNQKRRLI